MVNMNKFDLQYSNKTTGTINIKIPYAKIPSPIITVIDQGGIEK